MLYVILQTLYYFE